MAKIAGLAVAAIALGSCAGAGEEPAELHVYAATSLRDALQTIAPICEAATGSKLVFNFGASNDLARQIDAALKADVFLSADEAWMDWLVERNAVDASSRRTLLSNALAVVAPLDSTLVVVGAAELAGPGIRRLSLANPDAVPAGKYARSWLERAGKWDAVAKKILPGVDVRAALAAVESGAADAGIVYRTDARTSKKVRVLYEVPIAEGPAIRYPIAALAGRPNIVAARRLVACLSSAQAAATFERLGFIVTSR